MGKKALPSLEVDVTSHLAEGSTYSLTSELLDIKTDVKFPYLNKTSVTICSNNIHNLMVKMLKFSRLSYPLRNVMMLISEASTQV